MTDRELLHLAAKAAGLRVKWEIENMDDECIGLCVKVDGQPKFHWNPLADDGAALRLAVKLGIGQIHHKGWGQVMHPSFAGRMDFHYEDDSDAATRRAIVVAAAKIGRRLP